MKNSSHLQKVLVVDPDADFLVWAANQLSAPTVRVLTATEAKAALHLVQTERPDVVFLEVRLAPISGLELLMQIRQVEPNSTVLLTTAFPTTQAIIESMKLGAFDFVRKESLPFNLKMVVDSALQSQADIRSARETKSELTVDHHKESIIGKSEALQNVFKIIGRVAHSDAPVMITGESGSGKELVARALHHHSRRAEKSFVAINCAAIPENLLESELFGHEKGSFTGAVSQRIGRFEQCSEGTLFLDEIGDMPLPLQSKILRVLQDGEYTRVGGNNTLKTGARIVCATNKNLEDEVARKHFREDLFYRLNVVRVHLPPLRERVEDIRLLAEYFLQKIATEKRLPRLRLSEEAALALERYNWPGNIRELENTIQRAVVLATSDVLLPKDIPLGTRALTDDFIASLPPVEPRGPGTAAAPAPTATAAASAAPESDPAAGEVVEMSKDAAIRVLLSFAEKDPKMQLLPWVERELTIYAMQKTGGNQVRSAQLLGVTRATLRKRIERFGITKELNIR